MSYRLRLKQKQRLLRVTYMESTRRVNLPDDVGKLFRSYACDFN